MSEKLQAIRGMRDILPEESVRWQCVERKIIQVLDRYGYQEIRLPILEKTELFARSIGEQTDIVAKEMYSFEDRNGDSLTLRPEGTAGCVRAGLEHGLFYNQTQRLWYMGPMFRHERPQKGRQRQFHQIGVEAFGFDGPDIDAELIILSARLWRELGIKDITLQLNSLGTLQARSKYREILIDYFLKHEEQLDEDSRRRLQTNPLRILDSKNPELQGLINSAPAIKDHLDTESEEHFDQLLHMLNEAGIEYEINPRLVRGLDYYGQTVFEWVTDQLGAQGAICAGGRYNGLIEHFGGKSVPAFGFALGMERLMALIKTNGNDIERQPLHAYLILSAEEEVIAAGLKLAELLRDQLPHLRLTTHCGGGSFKSQFKRADKSGALFGLILGSEEVENQTVGLKSLRDKSEQETIPWGNIGKILAKNIQ
ncbi:MAG: histidine--tRNA ligase [Proteobacteria bacterium]|nr:histidine--tRNA ligase [Pseudomonadota bacterium]